MGGVLVMGSGVARADWPAPPDNIREHVVSLKEETPVVKAVREHLVKSLAGVKPGEVAGAQVTATAEKGYLVWGDLFKTGTCFALYEPSVEKAEEAVTMALAKWKDGKWELRGLWKMPLSWAPLDDRWSGSGYVSMEKDTPRAPFELEDLMADDAPEVIVSGEKTKYHQARYVMKYDKESHGLDLLTYSMRKPEKVGRYVQIYDSLGNKSPRQEWTFMEWMDGRLEERAVWHPGSQLVDGLPAFTLLDVTREGGRRQRYRIDSAEGSGEDRDVYTISESGRRVGTATVEWQPGKKGRAGYELQVGAWFFEKLAGMPREYFPETMSYSTYQDGKQVNHVDEKPERLENHATAKVEGNWWLTRHFTKTE